VTEVLTLPNDLNRMHELVEFATNFAVRHDVPSRERYRLLVILDELFSNIVRYGYPPEACGSITFYLSCNGDQLEVVVEDNGRPFDPLSVPEPHFDRPADARPTGGLGIHLVRSLVDNAQYSRRKGANRLVLTQRLSPAPGREKRRGGVDTAP